VAREDHDADDDEQSAADDLQLMQMTTKASIKSEEPIDADRGRPTSLSDPFPAINFYEILDAFSAGDTQE